MNTKSCSKCGKLFLCGNPGLCWCSALPNFMPLEIEGDCLCRECLIDIQNEKINQLINSSPLEEIIKIAAQYKSDDLFLKLDYTIEDDKWVFTKWFLLKRGFCCNSGCRNCPY